MTGLRSALRAETAALHHLAEDAVRRWTPLETRAGYRGFLQRLDAMHRRHAAALDRSSALAGLPPRSDALLAALAQDLEAHPGEMTRPSPQNDTLSPAWCLGVGYVFEGSALGAAVLLRQPPPGGWPSARYLGALSQDLGDRWSAFRRALEAHREADDTAVTAAKTVFSELIDALQSDRDAALPM